MTDTSIYYDGSQLLSYNRLLNFVVGNRGCGKTFYFKDWCIRDFKKNGKQFVWVRRYKTETKLMGAFFDDIVFKYPDDSFVVKGNKAYINNKLAGYFISLSIANTYKSVPFPNVNKIIYDEFIINKANIRYLQNECTEFLDLFNTVARLRDDVRAVFIANSVTVNNPYFSYFKVQPKPNARFTKFKDICIEYSADEAYIDAVYDTKFGRMISNTKYGDYAVENKFLLDNDEGVIGKKPENSLYQYTLCFNGKYYGVYYNHMYSIAYIDERKTLRGGLAVAVTTDDLQLNTYLAKSQYMRNSINTLKELFSLGRTRYSSIKVKSVMYDIMRQLNVK